MSWVNGGGIENETILSSRVRLARNLKSVPFPSLLQGPDSKKIIDTITGSISNSSADFLYYDMKEQSLLKRQMLVEKHLISPDLLKKEDNSGVMINSDETLSIMINEEDHIRIQVILPGLQLNNAWDLASKLDDLIEESVDYAFDETYGYLTSCPTNVGTGIRASVMVHLPALNLTGNINRILQAVVQVGLTIRGLYGEGTDIIGNIFQISNQITLGRSEEEIIDNLIAVTTHIIEKEKEARNILKNSGKMELEDKVWRSWGILKSARIMSSNECLKLLSDIRLGVDMGILPSIPISLLNEIMIDTQSASIQLLFNKEMNQNERDVKRARLIREKLLNILE